MFKSYAHALDWINVKSKEYGSKNAFYASDEYRQNYAEIQHLHKENLKDWEGEAEKAMKEVGVKCGDKVEYHSVSGWGHVDVLRGTIVKRDGLPKVKLDVKFNGRRYVKWHKGWKVI